MDSVSFIPGKAYLSSLSKVYPWAAVFEDEGDTGYLYAIDNSRESEELRILDAVLVYNVSSLEQRERLASLQWSRDGMQAVLYIDGNPQALVDFAARETYSRSNFPNFLESSGDRWRTSSHEWSDEAIRRFEAELYE